MAFGIKKAEATAEQLLVEIEELLRTTPDLTAFRTHEPEVLSWSGRLAAAIERWDPLKSPRLEAALHAAASPVTIQSSEAIRRVLLILNQAWHDLRIGSVGPSTVAVGAGRVFDYFDEVRKIVETAQSDVLFVDPYLDADFVSRYLIHVRVGTTVRLLARLNLKTLIPAIAMFEQQNGTRVQVRSAPSFHDRYVIVDGAACYQSGASFKDGGKTAPTTLTQISDAFTAVRDTYEGIWTKANIEH